MSWIRLLLPFIATLLLSGCLDIETLVRVRPDGSGEIEERFLMGGQLAALGAMQGEQGGSTAMFDRAELEQRAQQMGPGVTLRGVEPLSVGERQGYHAVFAFTDIGKVRLNQNPGDHAPSGGGMPGQGPAEELMTFEFHPGTPAELIVHSGMQPGAKDSSQSGGGIPGGDDPNAEMALGMMREMFKDMRIAITIEVVGQIIETNATHRQGSRITLLEMNFGKLLENPERFKEFAQQNPQTLEETKRLLKGLEGFQVELEPAVRIRFSEGGVIEAQGGGTSPPVAVSAVAEPTAETARPTLSPGWNSVALGDAARFMLDLVEVVTQDGREHKGMLVATEGQRLRLRLADLDGGGEVELPLSEVRELRVFDPGT